MNKTHDGKNYGMTQYCWPHDFELAGRTITLRSDAHSYVLRFQDREFIECGGVLSQYEALKLDSDLHVVFFGETITTAVLDLAGGTAVISIGESGQYDFCRVDGFDGSAELPSYTDEMTGTHVRWYFGCERYMEHEYLPDGADIRRIRSEYKMPVQRDSVVIPKVYKSGNIITVDLTDTGGKSYAAAEYTLNI